MTADRTCSYVSYRDSHTIVSTEIQTHKIFIYFKNFVCAKHGQAFMYYVFFVFID